MYAVKANPSPDLLKLLWDSGVTHYDVASIAEVRLLAETLPEATLCFMHPVKAEEAIEEAYFEHSVRTFSLEPDRKSVVEGKGVEVRVDLGGRRIINKKNIP